MIKGKITILNVLKVLWLVFSFIIIIWKGVIPGSKKVNTDFNNYYTASKLVLEGKSIHQFYNNDWFYKQAQNLGIKSGAKFSPFPPITAYAYIPLTIWEPLKAKKKWLIFNVLLLIILPFRIKEITAWPLITTMLFISLFSIPLISCLISGQIYLVIAFILLEVFGQVYMKNKPLLISLLIGITSSLKYVPILFLGFIIQNKNKYNIIFYTLSFIGVSILLLFLIDNKAYSSFFQHFQSHIQGDLPGQGKYSIGFQSIDSLLNNLFVYDSIKNPFPIINTSILKPIIKYSFFTGIVSILFILFKKNKFKATPIFVSICLISIFLLLPATASYHFLLLLLPLLIIFKWLKSFKSKTAISVVSLLSLITFSVQIHHIPDLSNFFTINLLLHYPRFWVLLCLFLVLSHHYNNHLSKNYG
ncbi:glycosyltransferase family 87 protein [Tenacibaculum retecalamus]|uniref:glycosyltransferase family 87 protein n=1 Tax=Tenacibaculum retecalamus TaxID=3018315 RepID=UPI0023D93DFB|nr:glycosyltransferase family 87 protein [Tenacibaculum retecalamus]WBX71660.1 glycosyltransferase family 87 protein [Tenacibaculum retecalamus]